MVMILFLYKVIGEIIIIFIKVRICVIVNFVIELVEIEVIWKLEVKSV